MLAVTTICLATLASASAARSLQSATNVAQLYEQCGGKDYTGPTMCASGLKCDKKNDYYSQCINTGDQAVAHVWQQCGGGEQYQGPKKCAEGLSCHKVNAYYSQCIKKESGSGTGTSPAPASSDALAKAFRPSGCGGSCPLYTLCIETGGKEKCEPCGHKGELACPDYINGGAPFACFYPLKQCVSDATRTCSLDSYCPQLCSDTCGKADSYRDCGLVGQKVCAGKTGPFCYEPFTATYSDGEGPFNGICQDNLGSSTCGHKGKATCKGKDYLCVPPLVPKGGKCRQA